MESLEFLEGRFRCNPALAVRRYEELDREQREAVGGLLRGGSFEAVLMPRGSERRHTAKVIDGPTADLLSALESPDALPKSVRSRPDDEIGVAVASLVLGGVLQVESEGGFLSGPSAHQRLLGGATAEPPAGRLGHLSTEALRYAESLPVTDIRRLSRRLYSYNRIPFHRRWARLVDRAGGPLELLGLGARDRLTTLLAAEYEESEHSGWHSWSHGAADPEKLSFKLYVSPHPESMAAALRAALEVLAQFRARAFKVGKTVFDLLRPDKFVAYFESREQVDAVAEALAPRLAGMRAQGVPFTAELTADGMLSHGVDPPLDAGLAQWRGLESWRLWISNQLAISLRLAHEEGVDGVEPWRFALDHLRLQGVDTATWSPLARRTGREGHSW